MGSILNLIFLHLLLIFCCCFVVSSNVIKPCGGITCNVTQYCDGHDDTCRPCADICDKSSHQYEERNCEINCQIFLYVEERVDSLKSEVHTFRNTISLIVALLCIVLVILGVVFLVSLFKWLKKNKFSLVWIRKKLKMKEKKAKENSTVATTVSSGKPDLHLDMPSPNVSSSSINGNTPSTATTTISRRPTEDSTLDYAYDNPVIMIRTPSPNPPPHESTL